MFSYILSLINLLGIFFILISIKLSKYLTSKTSITFSDFTINYVHTESVFHLN